MLKFIITGGNGFIGTNLVLSLREKFPLGQIEVYLIDIAAPKIDLKRSEVWINLNILEETEILVTFLKIKPDFVIHLAAQTSCDPTLILDDYLTNTKGSENVFRACENAGVQFLVNTSTQYVNQSGKYPIDDVDYAPNTIYGESKIIAEKLLREANYSFNWVTIRPTNIWGRWHLRYPYEFWKIIRDGKYYHPGNGIVVRSYGYVGNVCEQIIQLVELRSTSKVSRQVFYVGDVPVNLLDWVNGFSLAIAKRPAKVVHKHVVFMAALAGTILMKFKINFPITLSRYRSMTSSNPAPMEKTIEVLGKPKYSMQEGIAITTDWLFEFWNRQNV